MTWNYRIMRRYSPESPETYWYEIVEVFYAGDGIPMMFTTATQPAVTHMELEIESDLSLTEIDLETYVKESLLEQYTMMLKDTDTRGPILDERDFDKGGVYADHPEAVELAKKAQDENLDIREFLDDEEDDEDEDERI